MTGDVDARHHVRVGRLIFCTLEWIERPGKHDNSAAVRCPHNSVPLRRVRIRPAAGPPPPGTAATALINARSS